MKMNFKDYYKILEVEKTATDDEIKKAYRKLARKYHPDTNKDKDSESKFKDISEAYEVLRDPDKRHKYDNLGSSYSNFKTKGGSPNDFHWSDWYSDNSQQNGGTQYKTGQNVSDFFAQGGSGVSDFFERIFGSASSKSKNAYQQYKTKTAPKVTKGQDFNTEVQISLEDAFNGTTRILNTNTERIEVKFKPGIMNDQIQKIPGKGYPSDTGGKSGDLLITVKIASNKKYDRKGNDLYVDATIDVFSALLGDKINVKTFFGTYNLTIPPETQPGKVFKLSGQGMPMYNSDKNERGDLYVNIKIKLPKNLSKEEIELLKQLKSIRDSKSN